MSTRVLDRRDYLVVHVEADDGQAGLGYAYVGTAGLPEGPHSPTSSGFSDPDLTMDAAGNIYNVEINLANVSVFMSPDDGQSWPQANPVAASGDRPWVTGQLEDEVFLYVNLPKQLWRSTDAGLTYYESFGQNWERAALIKARVHSKK